MVHINIFLPETTRPTSYNWYVASRSRLLLSFYFQIMALGIKWAVQEVTCFMFIEKTLKIFVSDNKRHKVLIFGM